MGAADALNQFIVNLAGSPERTVPGSLDVVLDGGSVSLGCAYGILSYLAASDPIKVGRVSASGTASLLACLFLLGGFGCAELSSIVTHSPPSTLPSILYHHVSVRVREIPLTHVAALSGRLFVTYSDLRRGIAPTCSRFPRKSKLLRVLRRACRSPVLPERALCPRFCGVAAPRLLEDGHQPTLLVSSNHPARALTASLLPARVDGFSVVLDGAIDAHSFLSGRTSLHCSYYMPGQSLPAIWTGLRAVLLASLAGLVHTRQMAHLSQSENVGDG